MTGYQGGSGIFELLVLSEPLRKEVHVGVGETPLMVLTALVERKSTPRYPRVIDAVVGLIFGAMSATILVCTVMTSLSVIMPKVWSDYDRQKLILPMDRVPIAVYQAVEKRWLG